MVMAELMDKIYFMFLFLFCVDFLLSALSIMQLFKYVCVGPLSTDKNDDDYDKQENWKLCCLFFSIERKKFIFVVGCVHTK